MLKQFLLVILNIAIQILFATLQLAVLPLLAFLMLPFGLSKAMLQAWLTALVSLTAWLVVPFITKSEDKNNPSVAIRLYNTVDDPNGDQGMMEQQVVDVYDRLGFRIKTWYWLAGRNVVYGLANYFRPSYNFKTIQFISSGPESGIQCITAFWDGNNAKEYRIFIPLPFTTKKLIIEFGYKLDAYLDSTDPIKLNPYPDTDPTTDVGGVPFLTIRIK